MSMSERAFARLRVGGASLVIVISLSMILISLSLTGGRALAVRS
jgi:hypothetical protein